MDLTKYIDKQEMTELVIKNLIKEFKQKVLWELNDPEFRKELNKKKEEFYFTGGWSKKRYNKLIASVPPYTYQMITNVFGPEVWTDLKYFKKVFFSDDDLRQLVLVDKHRL